MTIYFQKYFDKNQDNDRIAEIMNVFRYATELKYILGSDIVSLEISVRGLFEQNWCVKYDWYIADIIRIENNSVIFENSVSAALAHDSFALTKYKDGNYTKSISYFFLINDDYHCVMNDYRMVVYK